MWGYASPDAAWMTDDTMKTSNKLVKLILWRKDLARAWKASCYIGRVAGANHCWKARPNFALDMSRSQNEVPGLKKRPSHCFLAQLPPLAFPRRPDTVFWAMCKKLFPTNLKCLYLVGYVCTTKETSGTYFGTLPMWPFEERYFLHLLLAAWRPYETVQKNSFIWRYAWQFCIFSQKPL